MNSLVTFQTDNGLTAQYNGRFLYSKRDAKKSPLSAVERVGEVAAGTLFFLPSPLFCYGVESLLGKIKDKDSFVVAAECEEDLFSITKESSLDFPIDKFLLLSAGELENFFFNCVEREGKFWGRFKRVVRLDLSFGSALHEGVYNDYYKKLTDAIFLFYKNRATLIKFGKRYSMNFFRNLIAYGKSGGDLGGEFFSINRPILVVGAGESIELLLSEDGRALAKKSYIVACDAAYPFLQKAGIRVDLLVTEDSQRSIKNFFFGVRGGAVAASLSSFPIHLAAGVKRVFYTTKFFSCNFFYDIKARGILPSLIEPLGSVGLVATKIALKMRAGVDCPVFILGLDFNFRTGKTHARGTYQNEVTLECGGRLKSFGSFFGGGVGTQLKDYGTLFFNLYSDKKGLFDLRRGEWVRPLGLKPIEIKDALDIIKRGSFDDKVCGKTLDCEKKPNISQTVEKYFLSEIDALKKIADLYNTGGSDKATPLILRREYLFLHFADWVEEVRAPFFSKSFYKRVAAECGYFIRLFEGLFRHRYY